MLEFCYDTDRIVTVPKKAIQRKYLPKPPMIRTDGFLASASDIESFAGGGCDCSPALASMITVSKINGG